MVIFAFLALILATFGVLFAIDSEKMALLHGTYAPIPESARGKNFGNIDSFSAILKRLNDKGGSVRFVFAFTTGHVGTTSMSVPAGYSAQDIENNNVRFIFEKAGVPIETYESNFKLKDEIQHVEYYYGPKLLEKLALSKANVRVDLSHGNLFFYRGLVHLLYKYNLNFTFIRIRRDRYETCLSMCLEGERVVDFFTRDYFRYTPFHNHDLVQLSIPGGRKTWDSFSMKQKAFWVIDEVETRWQTLLSNHPNVSFTEVNWSKRDDNFEEAMKNVSLIIGAKIAKRSPPKLMVQAGKLSLDDGVTNKLIQEDRSYQRAMTKSRLSPDTSL